MAFLESIKKRGESHLHLAVVPFKDPSLNGVMQITGGTEIHEQKDARILLYQATETDDVRVCH